MPDLPPQLAGSPPPTADSGATPAAAGASAVYLEVFEVRTNEGTKRVPAIDADHAVAQITRAAAQVYEAIATEKFESVEI